MDESLYKKIVNDVVSCIMRDAERWRWLREQRGWPESEAAMLDAMPEDFDKLADEGIKRSA